MTGDLVLTVVGLSAAGAGLVGARHGLRPIEREDRRKDWRRLGVYALIGGALLAAGAIGPAAVALVVVLVAVGGAVEIARLLPWWSRWPGAAGALLAIGAALAHLLFLGESAFSLFVVIVVAADAFSRFGARITQGNTAGRTAFGLATAIAAAGLFGFLSPELGSAGLAILAVGTAAAATAGDLYFSGLKRRAGMKEFSRLFPGHGGVLDRFAGLVAAAPAFYWLRMLLG